MAGKGKVTKTEIFCLFLSLTFVVLCAVLFFTHRPAPPQGVSVTTWKREDVAGTLPRKVNNNTADADELQLLPGVGPVLAGRIVAWREQNGDYLIAEDLLAVEGIGMTRLQEIRDFIVTEEEP